MKKDLVNIIDSKREIIKNIAIKIWATPELALEERFASRLLKDTFLKEGFKINDIDDLPTSFYAEYGSGKPIIGMIGEYDALPKLSQVVGNTQKPLVEDGAGHGCGHNLVAAGNAGAAFAIKEMIQKGELEGTIRYYGCPGEEIGIGKPLMAKKGVFDDLDVAFHYHPHDVNGVVGLKMTAVISSEFHFKGISSHAAVNPERGRSALDGVELMNVGANYLREHISESARLHYTITNGGSVPNIVPENASVWYFVRATTQDEVKSIYARLQNIAKGAGMMTDTKVTNKIKGAMYELNSNMVIEDIVAENMKLIDPMEFNDKEIQFAKELTETLPDGWREDSIKKYQASLDTYVDNRPLGVIGRGGTVGGSSDLGDVSYLVPTVFFVAAAWPHGIPAHSWQATAIAGSEIGVKSAIYASKVLASACYDLFKDDTLVKKAWKEFNLTERSYQSIVTDDLYPNKNIE